MEWLQQAKDVVEHNAFAQGGAVLAIVGGLIAWARNVPVRLYQKAKQLVTLSIEFDNRDALFGWFTMFLNEHPSINRKTHLKVTTQEGEDNEPYGHVLSEQPKIKIIYSFAKGTYLIKHRGVRMIVSRDKEDDGPDKKSDRLFTPERFVISTFRWNRAKIKLMIEDIYTRFSHQNADKVAVWREGFGQWNGSNMQPKRSLDTVCLAGDTVDQIKRDIEEFLSEEKLYAQQGVPYQRGYGLEGPPGTGKTSLIVALASHFNYTLCPINIGRSGLEDDQLSGLFMNVPDRAIVVLEDIDGAFVGRKPAGDHIKVTFSGLLNAINGVTSKHGRILVVTTNHVDQLDPALIREGRIDRWFRLDYADDDQIRRLFLKFYPDSPLADRFVEIAAKRKRPIAPSRLQELMLRNKRDPQGALDELPSLLTKRADRSGQDKPAKPDPDTAKAKAMVAGLRNRYAARSGPPVKKKKYY